MVSDILGNSDPSSEEQQYFAKVSTTKNIISPLSDGLNIDLTVAQRYYGLNAPVASFFNPVLDDAARDVFWALYLYRFGLTEQAPAGREHNRMLLEWLLADPNFDAKRFFTINMQIGAAAASNKMVEELMKNPQIKQAMNNMGKSEQKQQQADDLEQEADEQEQDESNSDDDQDQGDQDGENDNNDEDDQDDQDDQDDSDEEEDESDGDSDSDEDGDGESNTQSQSSPQQKRQQAQQLRDQAQKEQERGQQQLEQALNNPMSSISRSGAIKKGEEFAGEVNEFLSGWGVEQGEGMELSLEDIQMIMKLLSKKGLANLTTLMGRAYQTALSVLKGRNPIEIMIDTGGLTKNIFDVGIDQLALLGNSVPEPIRQNQMMKFFRSGLPGATRTSQSKSEGAFIWRNDGSGSMSAYMPIEKDTPQGEYASRSIVATGLALGLAKAAKENGQMFNLATFGSHGEMTTPVTQDSSLRDLLKFASFAFGGGTDFDFALNNAMDVFDALDDQDKLLADIGMSTDGEAGVNEATLERLYDLKERYGLRLHVLLIGGAGYGSIEEIADNLLEFESLSGAAEVLANAMWLEK